ncbi:protein PLASTID TRANSCRIPTIONALLY ACTIVE 7-like isoform X1 [Dendrobium catenatum]|uniref:protein PLASTID TRANSCRIPTIONALLY ACTIVE 7-like isoform X1 n=1 Tax=Dendrobium catenatum TaxID=906689 RepID=UPI0009F43FB9|nr:protein PLASTID TRANSCRIPTIONALLY ACTIVE 7-like isoform X1 [Dendrobium catenatum]
MALLQALPFSRSPLFLPPPPASTASPWISSFRPMSISAISQQKEGHNGRRIWRRRKLRKRDVKIEHKMDRVPFLEEQVRKIRETGKIMSLDIERLLLSEENRFTFVNEVAAEATAYVEKNRDEYGAKKAILHVLSNRMNDAGFHRSEAYMETDPFKPGPRYFRIPET